MFVFIIVYIFRHKNNYLIEIINHQILRLNHLKYFTRINHTHIGTPECIYIIKIINKYNIILN